MDFLDALRGLAALTVVLFHFTNHPDCLAGSPCSSRFTWLCGFGYSAVYIFFVLSGFVLPWAMERSQYALSAMPKFLAKRLLRLWPPSALILLLMAIHYHGWWPTSQICGELWHQMVYLSGILQRPRYLEIFWTLEVEMQFYLAVALLFPLLTHKNVWVRRGLLAFFCLLPSLRLSQALLPHFMGFFAMGMAVFWRKTNRCQGLELGGWICAAVLGSQPVFSWLNLGSGLLAAGLIYWQPRSHPLLTWLGCISYSLYLSHFMSREIAQHFFLLSAASPGGFLALLAFQVTCALAFATLFYFVIERPSQRWAAGISKR